MVADFVDNHFHAEIVSCAHELAKIVHCAELGIDGLIVSHGIVGAFCALAVFLAYGVNGHQPEYVDAEVFEAREL